MAIPRLGYDEKESAKEQKQSVGVKRKSVARIDETQMGVAKPMLAPHEAAEKVDKPHLDPIDGSRLKRKTSTAKDNCDRNGYMEQVSMDDGRVS